MQATEYDFPDVDIAWCPGCGNFKILDALKQALASLDISPSKLVIASGIGQAPKTPHYLKTHVFNGLHGRTLPVTAGIKAANPELTVIALGGDGDMYGEGGNHFVHAIRRNPDITHLVHNNMVYGLTKGQASPTSQPGFSTPVQVDGVFEEPFNPLATAIALNASFVARTFAGDVAYTSRIIQQAISHRGYALVDIFQPCVTFNRVNTFKWFKDNTYKPAEDHDPTDRDAAMRKALEAEPYPVGIIYRNTGRPPFGENLAPYKHSSEPLFMRQLNVEQLRTCVESFRT
jgi:2-oxoglutarate ferredoxin oxidoreductase subunit beta